jgi:O-acetylhomoserine/O-acetylserine sulfhydrylase-like pyridoxal-dependent enzyme
MGATRADGGLQICSIETLALRMDRIATTPGRCLFPENHPKVAWVPAGLPAEHHDHALALKYSGQGLGHHQLWRQVGG